MNNQKQLGKYYTVNNPFDLKAFRDWFSNIPGVNSMVILEPFAGSNNIVNLMSEEIFTKKFNSTTEFISKQFYIYNSKRINKYR